MSVFTQIGIIVCAAAILAVILARFKQPLILAYLLVGVIIGPIGLKLVGAETNVESLASIGIAFLLFIVGLELNFAKLKKLGSTVIVIALVQIIGTALLAYILAHLLGYNFASSIYISLALTFGSTVIVVQILSEKKLLDHLFGRIVLGILLIQDIVAVIALALLENFLHQASAPDLLLNSLLAITKTGLVVFLIWLIGHFFINKIIKRTAKTPELLFIIAIAWCFFASIVANYLGLSIEIGAFLAGISIASGTYTLEISAKVKPLRDFFIIIFFVILGLELNFSVLENYTPIIIFILFVLITHPLIILITMGIQGFKRRTSFLTGISIAQISEFSLILVALGYKLGHVNQELVSTITVTAIITIIISTYLISYSRKIFEYIKKPLAIFEHPDPQLEKYNYKTRTFYNHIILIGARRTGYNILKKIIELKEEVVVVDFNPELAEEMIAKKIPVIYGDATDHEILDNLNIREAKMLISTLPDFTDNLIIIRRTKKINHNITIYATAFDTEEALKLYQSGADYVILPQQISGEHVSTLLSEVRKDTKHIAKKRASHIKDLEDFLREHDQIHS